MSDHLIVGEARKLKARFTVDDVNTDPTAVTLEIKDPSNNTDTYTYSLAEITKDATGKYSKIVTFDEAGWWTWEWQGTGTVIDVANGRLYVRAQAI